MKYNVFNQEWYGVRRYIITQMDFAKFKDLKEDARERAILATVTYTHTNWQEMKQHAQKLAAYFEEVDTAKEAVIRCTKI